MSSQAFEPNEGRRAPDAEERFRLLVDNVRDYAFIMLDEQGCVVGWNQGAERILGYSEAEILGRSASVFFTPEDRARHADEQEIQTAQRQGRAEDERWHLRANGSRFWGSGVLTALYDRAGILCGYGKVLRDQTTQHRAEQNLRESEERFRLFAENVTDYALVQVDVDGRVSGWNTGAARIFGYLEAEICGQSIRCLFTAEDAADGHAERILNTALADGRSEDARWMVRRDGRLFWARWVTTPMRDAKGNHCGFAKVLKDETDRQWREDERGRREQVERERLEVQVKTTGEVLDRTKDELRDLAAGLMEAQEEERRRIARELHDDLAQQLAVLDLNLAQVRQEFHKPSASLESAIRRLAAVSQAVQAMSHGLHPSILEQFGLETALRSLADEWERMGNMGVRYISRLQGIPVPLSLATVLYRIAQEALRNVAKHAGDARVTIILSQGEGQLRLSIEDDGDGFDIETLHRRPGLGLISMKERARLVSGSFELRSAPGKGTRLNVSIPFNDQSR